MNKFKTKHQKVETTEDAIKYLQSVLLWDNFINTHLNVKKSIEILLQEVKGTEVSV